MDYKTVEALIIAEKESDIDQIYTKIDFAERFTNIVTKKFFSMVPSGDLREDLEDSEKPDFF